MPPKPSEARKELRLPINKRGKLAGPSKDWVPCMIQDFSRHGMLVMCNHNFSVKDQLELRCEIYPEKVLNCKVEVRHSSDMCYGTQIVEMDETAKKLCLCYADELYALTYFERARPTA